MARQEAVHHRSRDLPPEVLRQRCSERGDDQHVRAAGLLHPRREEGPFCFQGHEGPAPAAPAFWRGPGVGASFPEPLLESGDGGPPHAQPGRGFFQGRPGQGGQEDGLGGSEFSDVGGLSDHGLRLDDKLRIEAARSWHVSI